MEQGLPFSYLFVLLDTISVAEWLRPAKPSYEGLNPYLASKMSHVYHFR